MPRTRAGPVAAIGPDRGIPCRFSVNCVRLVCVAWAQGPGLRSSNNRNHCGPGAPDRRCAAPTALLARGHSAQPPSALRETDRPDRRHL